MRNEDLFGAALAQLTLLAELSARRFGDHDGSYRADFVRRAANAGLEIEAICTGAWPGVEFIVKDGGGPIGVAIERRNPGPSVVAGLRRFPGKRILILRQSRSALPIAGVDAVIAARGRRYARWRPSSDEAGRAA